MEELAEELSELMNQTKVYYDSYQQAKMRESMKRDELKEYMQSKGLLSARTKLFTATIVSKPTIEIKHEQSILDWLREEPDIEEEFYIGLKNKEFKTMALARMKETGEEIDGCETVINEYLTIKKKE